MEEEFCKTVPRETCDPERVLPKQETKPLVKKVCVEESQDMSEDDDEHVKDINYNENIVFKKKASSSNNEDAEKLLNTKQTS